MDDAKRQRLREQWEQIGEDSIRADMNSGGIVHVGGPPEVRLEARNWLNEKAVARAARNAAATEDEAADRKAGVNLTLLSVIVSIFAFVIAVFALLQ